MVGWLIYSIQDVEKNKHYIQFYAEEGKLLDMDIRLILIEDFKFGIWDNKWFMAYKGEAVKYPDFAICRTIYPLFNKQLEYMGIPVFNNSHIAEICNDKAKTCQYVAQSGIPMVDTTFLRNSLLAKELEAITGPTVIKTVAGHGGNQVYLFEPRESTSVEQNENPIYDGLNGSDIVLQPLMGSRHQDLRVYAIGKEIVGSVLRTAREGFKSNFSLGGEVREYDLSPDEILLVKKIIQLFDIGMVGIDFIIGDKGELIFNEIEDVVGARMLYQCTDINLVRLYLKYIMTRISPARLT